MRWTYGKEVYAVVDEMVDDKVEQVEVLVADMREDGTRVILEEWYVCVGPYRHPRDPAIEEWEAV